MSRGVSQRDTEQITKAGLFFQTKSGPGPVPVGYFDALSGESRHNLSHGRFTRGPIFLKQVDRRKGNAGPLRQIPD